ncbi:MAG: RecX family transcriptional regulator [Candidatus Aegiribacteria sp.]|nr:RecX family transcriptional regulator [Candidatus Aegiribacteria sp.]
MRIGLETDVEIDAAAVEEVAVRKQAPAARKDTERHLAKSERTVSQLRRFLLEKQYHKQVIEDTLEWAKRSNLVDDERYASIFLRSHSGNSPMGKYRIRTELQRRGVEGRIIDSILEEHDDRELSEVLIRTVKSRYAHLDRDKAFRRAAGYLKRRGFNSDLIMMVLKSAFNDKEMT